MLLYKDSYGINHRSALKEKIKELSLIVKEDNYDEVLLPHPRKRYAHQDEHFSCSMVDAKASERITEKRICRCWNYFNKEYCNSNCAMCSFGFKKVNAGKIVIKDYEVPTEFAMEQLGGIDWLLDVDGVSVAAEVKPHNSSETLVRMIAEILTYTIGTSHIPAICFFKTDLSGNPSKQMIDYLKLKDNDDFLFIKEKTGLKVLYITFDKNSFVIHNDEEEPIQ